MTTTSATSAAANGSSILTALGAGSGIDTSSLITGLVSASFDPKDSALKTKETANSAQISSLGTLTGKIDTFASALNSLIQGGTLFTQPTTSDSTILTATAKPGSSIGKLAATLDVRQVAQAQSLVSTHLASATTPVGLGSLTLTTGAGTATIRIDASNNTLAGLAKTINASALNVTASIVTDGSGARLVLKGATGTANAFTLGANADADADLQRFAFPVPGGVTAGMTQAQTAQDAIVRMDGVDITRPTNTIGDVVDGVTLNLVAAKPGTTVTLGANRPTAAISQAVSDFVSAYNEMLGDVKTATAAPVGDSPAGPLYGNPAIRQMQRQLAKLTSTTLNSAGGPSTLAEIGVSTNLDGTLKLNAGTLTAALQSHPDAVEAMFNPTQHSDNPLIQITSAMGATPPGTYQLTNVTAQTGSASAQGTVAGLPGVTTGTSLFAASKSKAAGLVIQPLGDVASATVTVDPGLGGALQAIRDGLRNSGGVLDALSTSLATGQKDLADQRTKLTSDESAYRDQLTAQFASMTKRVANYNSIKSYLTQQVAVWTKSNN